MTEAPPTPPANEVSEAAEAARAASAFDERVKQISQPVEVEDGVDAAKVPPVVKAAPEVKTPEGTEEEFPAHVIDGTNVQTEAPKDDELEAITPPAKMSQAGTSSFAQLRALAERRGLEAQRLAKELEAAKTIIPASDPQNAEQVKAAQERIQALETELEKAAFERSPKFKALMAEGQQAIDTAKSYLEGGEIDASVIDRAASVSGAKRLSILREAGMDSETISAVAASLVDLDKTNARRNSMLEQHKTVQGEWEQQQRALAEQNEKRLQAEEEKIFTQVGQRVQQTFPTFQKVPGNDKWNAQVDQLNAEAREFFLGNLPTDKTAEIAYAGVAYRVEHRRANILAEQLKAERALTAKLKAAQPGGGESNGSRVASANAVDDSSPEAIARRFEQRLGR